MLEQEETLRLIALAQKGDNDAKATLLTHNAPLIKCILRRYKNKGIEYDDLYQLGCIGLLKAIKNFSAAFGVKFSTYAVPMIMGEIKRYIRDDGYIKVSRSTKTLAGKISYFVENVKNKEGRSPSIEEIAGAFSIDPQEAVFAMDSGKTPVSIYDKGDDEHSQSLSEKLTKGDGTDDTIDKLIIKDVIKSLDERERKIIVMRYYKDKTQSEVAKSLNVSQVQISRLETKIIDKLRAGFKG
ncbi:MAG: SigB/SigF/SigG family RNA polymerase sigma factor [Clostridiales bacterium]|nr:SigB/SigF/SigG family RNA polymerase sigma factor [Clostridiales bacterium]